MSDRLSIAFPGNHFPNRKNESRLKIAYVHNKYIGYRLPFFEKLAKMFDIKFFFDEVDTKTRVQKGIFPYAVLRSVQILRSSIYDLTWSPMLPYYLLKDKYNLFIGGGVGHPGTWIAFIIARLLRKPFIVFNEGWYYSKTLLRSVRQPFLNEMLQKSSAIIVPGKKAKEFMLRCGVDPEKIFIAPNASKLATSNVAISHSEKLKEVLGIQDKYVVLYLGRLIERKGVAVLINAFSKLHKEIDAALVIAGEGEERKKLENLCLKLKVKNVVFVGYVDEENKSLYYSIADVFVLPSIAHSGEVWDLVLNEAMSLGKPVISTTAAGASYDLIQDGVNGYVVKDGDSVGLSNAIKRLLENPDLLRKMGLESKRIVDNYFTFDKMVEGVHDATKYSIAHAIDKCRK